MAHNIVLDAEGGDHAPQEIVKGAVQAARSDGLSVILTGREAVLRAELAKNDAAGLNISVVDAPDNVQMDEHAVAALRHHPQSSLAVGLRLVKEGKAEAFVSAGNSGAAMAGALFILGRIKGVERPAIATPFPTSAGPLLLLDIGANAEVRPQHLVQFGLLGAAYIERALGVPNPRVALLNIGEEEGKGTPTLQEAYRLFTASGQRFVGNVEGRDIPRGEKAEVVVCDGLVGNTVLKLSEGLGSMMFELIRSEITRSWRYKLAGAMLRPAFRRVRARLDYEEYGGAPLLGVNGITIFAHGSSNAKAIANALRVANRAAEQRLVETIAAGVEAAAAAVITEQESAAGTAADKE